MSETYTIIDFETTGLDYENDQVIEIAALKVDENFKEIGSFQTMVRLERELPSFITELTGITEGDLINAPNELHAASTLFVFCWNTTVIAQNAPFDLSFMSKFGEGEEGALTKSFICTRALTKLVEPNESASLKATCGRHGVNLEGHHRAMNDVRATLEVFKIMKEKAEEQGIEYYNTVIDMPDRPLKFIPEYAKVIKLAN